MKKKIAVFVNGYGMDSLYAVLKGIKSVEVCGDFDFFIFVSYASYDDFDDLVAFTKEVEFDHMGTFKYSREDGTASYNFPDQIDDHIKGMRYNTIMQIQKTISYKKNKEHIGEVMEGIVTAYDPKSDQYSLRSYWNAPDDIDGNIFFKANTELHIGDIVKVKIESAFVYDLFGNLEE